MRTSLLLVVGVGVGIVICSTIVPATAISMPGAWEYCNVDALKMQELGKWAVAEHVKMANDGIRFIEVWGCEEQVVQGVNYRVFLDAFHNSGEKGRFQAGVYEGASSSVRKLVSFDPIM